MQRLRLDPGGAQATHDAQHVTVVLPAPVPTGDVGDGPGPRTAGRRRSVALRRQGLDASPRRPLHRPGSGSARRRTNHRRRRSAPAPPSSAWIRRPVASHHAAIVVPLRVRARIRVDGTRPDTSMETGEPRTAPNPMIASRGDPHAGLARRGVGARRATPRRSRARRWTSPPPSSAIAGIDPDIASLAHWVRGLALHELDRLDEAVTEFRSAIDARHRSTTSPMPRHGHGANLAISLLQQGAVAEARRELTRAQAVAPPSATGPVLVLTALFEQRTGRHDEALRLYEQALPHLNTATDTASLGVLHLNRGVLYAYRGQFSAAQRDGEQAERIAAAEDLLILGAMAAHNLGLRRRPARSPGRRPARPRPRRGPLPAAAERHPPAAGAPHRPGRGDAAGRAQRRCPRRGPSGGRRVAGHQQRRRPPRSTPPAGTGVPRHR